MKRLLPLLILLIAVTALAQQPPTPLPTQSTVPVSAVPVQRAFYLNQNDIDTLRATWALLRQVQDAVAKSYGVQLNIPLGANPSTFVPDKYVYSGNWLFINYPGNIPPQSPPLMINPVTKSQ